MGKRISKIVEGIEKNLLKIIQEPGADKKASGWARFWLGGLKGVSLVFGWLVRLRLFLFRHHVKESFPLICQVISVGNLTAGGTGKTPVVEKLARELHRRGRKVAILSRGYRSVTTKNTPSPRVVGDGQNVLLDSAAGGDEPYMLAKNLPGVAVVVDRDRVKAGKHAMKEFGCDTLVLDDGLQYLKIRRSLEIVLVDKKNPFGNGNLLPRGILREPVKNIRRADYVFITKSDGGSAALRGDILKHNPGVEIVECNHTPRHLRDVATGEELPLEWLGGKKIFALAGIAAPRRFEEFCQQCGGVLLRTKHFADHHRYTEREIHDCLQRAAHLGCDALVTTEKDAVRFPRLENPAVRAVYLRVDIEVTGGGDVFERILQQICDKKQSENPLTDNPL